MTLGRETSAADADRAIGWWVLAIFGCVACSGSGTASRSEGNGTGGAPANTGGGGLGAVSGGGTHAGGANTGGAIASTDSGIGTGAGTGSGGNTGTAGDGGAGDASTPTTGGAGGSLGTGTDGGPCSAVEATKPLEGAAHTNAPCDPVTYLTNPPSSGTHYGIWTEYKTYDAPVPEGFWVHSLEHGAIVISYNCPEGCATEVAAAQTMIDSLPVDPLCYPSGGTSLRRVVMTPDPHLTTRFAASAWGFTLRATCFDAPRFRAFTLAHYAHTAEDFCSPGGYVPADYPATCGQ